MALCVHGNTYTRRKRRIWSVSVRSLIFFELCRLPFSHRTQVSERVQKFIQQLLDLSAWLRAARATIDGLGQCVLIKHKPAQLARNEESDTHERGKGQSKANHAETRRDERERETREGKRVATWHLHPPSILHAGTSLSILYL